MIDEEFLNWLDETSKGLESLDNWNATISDYIAAIGLVWGLSLFFLAITFIIVKVAS